MARHVRAKTVVSSKGQVVIPKALREAMAIHAGSELRLEVRADGSLLATPTRRPISDFFGCCKKPGELPLSIEEIDQEIMGAVSDDDPD